MSIGSSTQRRQMPLFRRDLIQALPPGIGVVILMGGLIFCQNPALVTLAAGRPRHDRPHFGAGARCRAARHAGYTHPVARWHCRYPLRARLDWAGAVPLGRRRVLWLGLRALFFSGEGELQDRTLLIVALAVFVALMAANSTVTTILIFRPPSVMFWLATGLAAELSRKLSSQSLPSQGDGHHQEAVLGKAVDASRSY